MFRYLALGLFMLSAAPALAAEYVFENTTFGGGTSFFTDFTVDGWRHTDVFNASIGRMESVVRVDDEADTIAIESINLTSPSLQSSVVRSISLQERPKPFEFPDVPATISQTIYIDSLSLELPTLTHSQPLDLYYSHADVYRHDRAMNESPEAVIGRVIGRYVVEGPTERFEGSFDRALSGVNDRLLPRFEVIVGDNYPTSLSVLNHRQGTANLVFSAGEYLLFDGVVDGVPTRLTLSPSSFRTAPEPSSLALLALCSVAVFGRLRATRRRAA
jgi:hypothetical protein